MQPTSEPQPSTTPTTFAHNSVTPYGHNNQSKKAQVEQMFDNISARYDLLNRVLSLGIDVLWRKRACKELQAIKPQIILDIATGTGDFALEAAKSLKPTKIIGVDISEGMLSVGRNKIQKAGLNATIDMVRGDSEHLPFADGYADAVTVGFGVRNFENLEQGLREIARVLRPDGMVVILEPSTPTKFPLKQLFHIYFTRILPLIGKAVSKDPAAYQYLPASVGAFPSGEAFLAVCRAAGFNQVRWHQLTFGICALYVLQK